MDVLRPTLTEPGVKYFLKETLKNCKIKKDLQFNMLMNLGLLGVFVIIVSILHLLFVRYIIPISSFFLSDCYEYVLFFCCYCCKINRVFYDHLL